MKVTKEFHIESAGIPHNSVGIRKRLNISRASNIAFLLDIAQMSDLDFGLIQQNISIKKASFQY